MSKCLLIKCSANNSKAINCVVGKFDVVKVQELRRDNDGSDPAGSYELQL
jgi:hypothetical protein